MGIPQQVLEMEKKADELIQAQNKPAGDDVVKADPEKTEPEPKPSEPEPSAPQPPVDNAALETLNQRLKVVQGMLDRRNDDYRNLERTLNADIVERDRTISQLQAKVAELEKKPATASTADLGSMLSQEELEAAEREGLGPVALQLISKLTTAIAGKEATQKTETLKKQVQTVEERTAVNASDRFFDALDKTHSDWRTVNTNQQWHQYLNGRITGTRNTRQDLINSAQAALDPNPIIELLTEWKQMVGWGKAVEPAAPKKGLNDVVDPVKTVNKTTNPSQTQGPNKIWTKAEVTSFYAHASASKLAVRDPAEYNRVDQEIQLAARQGRVQ